MSNALILQKTARPSHGRGRRFNPYSAHHFTGTSCVSVRQIAAHEARTRLKNIELSLNSVRGVFA